jgi:8-oxo-dGTP pyrophosphatase MutT (NUDIX family)
MEWTVHGERPLYESDWVDLKMVDVEVPGGERFDHHVVRMRPAAGVIMFDPERGVLLLWRHRFITDTWGWEIPGGRSEEGETLEECAAREGLEESGWQPGPLRHLTTFFPANGVSDLAFSIFLADGATYVGEPTDPSESERVSWVPLDKLRSALASGRVNDGMALAGLCYAFALGHLGDGPDGTAGDGDGDGAGTNKLSWARDAE